MNQSTFQNTTWEGSVYSDRSHERKEINFQDIDILMKQDIGFHSALSFKNELEIGINQKVDLALKKYANPIILLRARKEMIYVKE